ncbi:tRNA lysidine(34) synthetase TilS, partial [uncultured Oscillibacter sp.]
MTTRTELLKRAPRTVLPRAGQRVLCAVSGGLDSMCLLHMLEAWCEERGGQAAAAHFNHRLRGAAADRDEEFVREICARWGIPLSVGRGDVGEYAKREGLSTEEAARNLRYAFLRRTAAERECERLYTAHHAGDNAETVLLNLIRGTGLTGLTGMDWERDGLCRPLLGVTREELEAYAAEWKIPHIEDATNADPEAAARNLLRLQVMPLLKELNPRAVEHICGTARRLRGVDRSLEQDAAARTAHAEVQEGRVTLSMEALAATPAAVRPRMLLRLFDLLGVGRKDVGAAH